MDSQFERALQVRKDVLGAAYVEAAMNRSAFTAPFQEFVTNFAWGEGWLDDSIDLKVRSLVTIAIVTTMGQLDEIRIHVAAALRNGVTSAEIAAVIKHVALYAGIARGVAGMNIADTELAKIEAAKESSAKV
ncbi:MAG TPA: carboxymuconolactone decarboxylase family protein [Candidatus Nanopelagicaceae bacterium]